MIKYYIFTWNFENKTTEKHKEGEISLEVTINIWKYFSSPTHVYTCFCFKIRKRNCNHAIF